MLRVSLKSILVLLGVCWLPILLIRAQPYDDSQLNRLLVPPETCDKPCLLGIQPGVTPIMEAQTILEAQSAIANVTRHAGVVERYQVNWQCGDVPCDCSAQVLLLPDDASVVNWMRVDDPCLRLGDLVNYLGEPLNITYFNRRDPSSQPIIFPYPQDHVVLYFPTWFCQTEQSVFWHQSLEYGIIVSAAEFNFVRWYERFDRERGIWHSTIKFNTDDWAYQLRRRRPKAWRSICNA